MAEGLDFYRARVAEANLRPRDLAMEIAGSPEAAARRAERVRVVDVGGVKVSVDADEREFGRAIARDATWETHVIQTIRDSLKSGDVFVDIGANVGVMSFHAAAAVGPRGRVVAFEPNPENIQRFLHGLMLNSFDQVRLWPLAASDGASVLALRGGSNSYLGAAAAGETLVQAIQADALLSAESYIHLIKLDIEGHEPRALSGLSRTIARCKPLLLCEFNPRCLRDTGGMEAATFADQLFRLGSVEIVEYDARRRPVFSPQELIRTWETRDAEHVAKGDLPPGMVHLDLLVRTA